MVSLKIRPHHILCMQFFIGKGYSSGFTANMAIIRDKLKADNPLIQLISGTDIICEKCPNTNNGICKTQEKVLRYDAAVANICDLEIGQISRWSELEKTVTENLIKKNRLCEVCNDCCWYEICRKIAET